MPTLIRQNRLKTSLAELDGRTVEAKEARDLAAAITSDRRRSRRSG
jgi:hypothetical protein